ncbi:MAG: hypothetical protein ACLQQ4_08525 [Bacteroidia bacterium]
MKKSKIIFAILCLIGLTAFGQIQTSSITGTLTKLSPFNDQYSFMVGKTYLVLIVDARDKTRSTFEINPEYKDILIKDSNGKYELNPKYADKTFKITYYINGKGWKCIKTLEPSN